MMCARRLAQAIERVTGVQLGAVREMFEVFDGNELAFGNTVNIHVRAEAVLHALVDQFLFQRSEPRGRRRPVGGGPFW